MTFRHRQIIGGANPHIAVLSPSPAAVQAALRMARGEVAAPEPPRSRPAAGNVRPAAPTPRAATPPARPAARPAPQPHSGYRNSNGQIEINGEITPTMAYRLAMDLNACHGSPAEICVSSRGGDLVAGIAIAKAIKEHGQVTAILRRADSAALAFCAAQTVRAVRDQDYLLHDPTICVPQDVSVSVVEMHAAADATNKNFVKFSRLLDKRISDGLFRLLASADRRLTAEEMVVYKLADVVIPPAPAAPAPASDDDENDEDLEAVIAAAVRDAIKQQLDAWKQP